MCCAATALSLSVSTAVGAAVSLLLHCSARDFITYSSSSQQLDVGVVGFVYIFGYLHAHIYLYEHAYV